MPHRIDATGFLGAILKFLGSFRARARLGPAFHETAQHDRTHKAGYACLLPRPPTWEREGGYLSCINGCLEVPGAAPIMAPWGTSVRPDGGGLPGLSELHPA